MKSGKIRKSNKDQTTKLTPAIPPSDYKGSVGKWMIELQTRGLWDGQNPEWHGDVMIESDIWWEMVEKLES